MDFNGLHAQYTDDDSPSVEGQIRWLQKQGFQQHQIEQAMLTVYTELDQGRVPVRWKNVAKDGDGREVILRKYSFAGHEAPTKQHWEKRPIKGGYELDQVLLEYAKKVRTDELSAMVRNMETFEENLKRKWKKQYSKPWYKRIFGKPIAEEVTE